MAITLNIRKFNLSANGADLGTFATPDELGDAFVAHFGKGYRGLAAKLVDALKRGKDTSRLEMVLGIKVTSEFVALAA